MTRPLPKRTIGRIDRADFPDLGLQDIEIKIDTGAYTGAIHCHNIAIVRHEGVRMVRFNLLDPSHPHYDEQEFALPVHRVKRVKSSSGQTQNRIFIRTRILLFGELLPLELSLTDRSDMKYPVLLGRKLLKGRFVVDVARSNLSYRQKRKSGGRSRS